MSVITVWDGYKWITYVQGGDATVSDIPKDSDILNPISSNWAYDHENATDPHPNLPVAHTIQEEGISLAQRSKLNFSGAAISVSDNGSDTTTVSVESVGLVPTMFSAEMRKSADQTNILSSADRLITWETALYEDYVGMCDIVNDSFVIPPGCDRANIHFSISNATNNAYYFLYLTIYKNGSVIHSEKIDQDVNHLHSNTDTGVFVVAEGDIITFYVYTGETAAIVASGLTRASITCWKSKAVVPNLQFHGALVTRQTSNFDVGTAAYTAIQFNTEAYDTRGFFDIASPTRLTVPAGVTHVRLSGGVKLSSSSGDQLLCIYKNGSSTYAGYVHTRDNDTATDQQYQVFTAVLEVVAGDYFTLVMYSGNGADIIAGNYSWFAIEEVKPISVEGGSNIIENEGTPLTQRNTINFVGNGVNVTDDGVNNKTIVTIAGDEYTPIVLVDFSWINKQTSEVLQNPDGSVWLQGYASSGAGNLASLVKSAPTPPYTISVCFQPFMRGGNYGMSGIGWRDSATGKVAWFGHTSHTSYVADNLIGMWNINADGSTLGTYIEQPWPGVSRGSKLWFRIEDDGVNRKWYLGPNGINWVLINTATRLDHLTPNQVLFGVASWSSNQIPRALFYSWKEE